MIYECDALEILRTAMDAGSVIDSLEFGDFSAVHLVIDGAAFFRAANRSADLMPGDSIVFNDERPYTVLNGAPSRSVILSILWKTSASGTRA